VRPFFSDTFSSYWINTWQRSNKGPEGNGVEALLLKAKRRDIGVLEITGGLCRIALTGR
jgi:hypothetical protein